MFVKLQAKSNPGKSGGGASGAKSATAARTTRPAGGGILSKAKSFAQRTGRALGNTVNKILGRSNRNAGQ